MIIPVIISLAVLLLVIGGGAVIWFVLRQKRALDSQRPLKQATTGAASSFHWRYIILPVVFLLLSVILVIYFYHRLPAEVAYHFQRDGSPDKWLRREMIVLWLLLPQFLLAGIAVVLTWVAAKLMARFQQAGSSRIELAGVLSVMGNMVALPQVILCFAMLDIFSYNSYRIHLMPLWVFALIIMVLGGMVLGVFFLRAMWRIWSAASKT